MTLLNNTDALYLGAAQVDAVYVGNSQVWANSFARYFAGGRQGCWIDPSDTRTIFQDAAGTVPVTANGQPVGRINDKSGRGNHLVQPVAANRPTYRTEGNRHWLQFDGANDFMSTALPATLLVLSAFVGVSPTGSSTEQHILGQYRTTGAARSWRIHQTNWPTVSVGAQYSPGGTSFEILGHTENINPMIIGLTANGSQLNTYRNGQHTESVQASLYAGGSANIFIGNGEGFNQPFAGKLFSALVIDRVLTHDEITEYTVAAATNLG